MKLSEKVIDKYLKDVDQGPYISIYMPTIPSSNSQTINEDKIRFKNALQAISSEVEQHEALESVYRQLESLLENHDFWLHQGLGLAVLASPEGYETVKLPFEVTPVAKVADRYVVSPLLVMNDLFHSYYLLDVNLKNPRFYVGSTYSLQPVEDAELPGAMEDEIDIEERKRTVGFRAGAGAQGSATFYGYDKVDESHDNNVELYLRMVAEAVDKVLHDIDAPLLLAGSEKPLAILRPMFKHSAVVDENINVDHDAHRELELHREANKAIAQHSYKARQARIEHYQSVNFEQRIDGVTAVQVAANNGQVAELILPVLRVTTDSVRSISDPQVLVELPNESFDDFEAAVRSVAEQSGDITSVEEVDFAKDPSMKAVLRFA